MNQAGPQWKRVLALIRDNQVDGMWARRYKHSSGRKLEILQEAWK